MTERARETGGGAAGEIRLAARQLTDHRRRPLLLYVSRQVAHADFLAVRVALGERPPEELDALVASPGGDIEAAYLIARELRRGARGLTVYVPLRAKSAATLLALAADELVFGPLGELGPLDAQYAEKQAADFPLNTSRLLLDTALREVERRAVDCFDRAAQRILERSGMRPFEACAKAAELVGALYGPLLGRLDPARLAESARALDLGRAYADRLLRRYRAGLSEEDRARLLDRLVRDYPAHGFVLDQEEAGELGLPVREPDAVEAECLDDLGLGLIQLGEGEELIELLDHPARHVAAARRAAAARPKPQPRGKGRPAGEGRPGARLSR